MIIEPGITIPRGITISSASTAGQIEYRGNVAAYLTTSPSTTTYTWVCPAGVTSVSVVCVGAGGSGCKGDSSPYTGGGGGGLGWKNNIPVVPGNSYNVVVGNGGPRANETNGAASEGADGGSSYFIDEFTVVGYGGQAGIHGGAGGSYVGDGGGNGGDGSYYGGGGGAGGYDGQGSSGDTGAATSQSGAAAGGNGSRDFTYNSDTNRGNGGGGVGILGKGISGLGSGMGGSGGNNGNDNQFQYPYGGAAGGGGGRGGTGSYGGFDGGGGGPGAVRIIWGIFRSFPSTGTGNIA